MSFGVYIHIPYCLQRCTYCDFATYVHTETLPAAEYVDLLKNEMSLHRFFPPQKLDTIYFGGGTPSLIEAELIVSLIKSLANNGYERSPVCEVTIEINPATVDEKKLNLYLENGINRFSVGAQTFDDRLLKMVHREHNAQQTIETLSLLRKYKLNFSFDLLFALPGQTLEGVQKDLKIALEMGSSHISPYCLTVPAGHPLAKGRAPEDEQVDMFAAIDQTLTQAGLYQYEISNYSRPGFESKHNLLYWTDQEYWGLGLSAHSYRKEKSAYGERFFNANTMELYAKNRRTTAETNLRTALGMNAVEELTLSQAVMDFCHTSLRLYQGLSRAALLEKFSVEVLRKVEQRLTTSKLRSLLIYDNEHWRLTSQGRLLSNLVFAELIFETEELLSADIDFSK